MLNIHFTYQKNNIFIIFNLFFNLKYDYNWVSSVSLTKSFPKNNGIIWTHAGEKKKPQKESYFEQQR